MEADESEKQLESEQYKEHRWVTKNRDLAKPVYWAATFPSAELLNDLYDWLPTS